MTAPSTASESVNTETHPLLSIAELAARLRVCERTVRRLIKGGDLAAYRVGGQLRVSEEDLAAYLRARRLGGQSNTQNRSGED